jgi:hypothetical protein
MITLDTTDRSGLQWAQGLVTREHYLHAPVDPRCRPLVYLVHYHYASGAHAAAGPRCVGLLFFGRPEATRCYDGGLTYGSLGDVQTGRAQYDRWEVLNLARVWFSPIVQPGGLIHRLGPDSGLPGYADRRGVWRSTLASSTIRQALDRIGYDYLAARPPVDCQYPYQIRAVLSYCDTRIHRGTIYRAAGFQLARTNKAGIETWWTPAVAPLAEAQDRDIRARAEITPRSQRIRAERMQLPLL